MFGIDILIIFIAGVIFCQWVMPVLDSLIGIILQALELVKTKIIYHITKIGMDISNLEQTDNPEPSTRAIGFNTFNEEEYDDDDDL